MLVLRRVVHSTPQGLKVCDLHCTLIPVRKLAQGLRTESGYRVTSQ